MAPKNKFTKEAMADAALRVVRTRGIDGLTAKTMADELGTPRSRSSQLSAPWTA